MTPPRFPTPVQRLAMDDFLLAGIVDHICYARNATYRMTIERERQHMREAAAALQN